MDYLGLVLAVALAAAALVVISRRIAWRGRLSSRHQQQLLELAKRPAKADVVGFGDELAHLEASHEVPASDGDLRRARHLHTRASRALSAARRPDDLFQVTAALEEARWSLARLTARTAGRPMPPRRPPCFFNPGHGPSTRNVFWHGMDVPACASDAERVRAGADPYIRTVERDDSRVPYWEGGPAYSGWARGYYASWRDLHVMADSATSRV